MGERSQEIAEARLRDTLTSSLPGPYKDVTKLRSYPIVGITFHKRPKDWSPGDLATVTTTLSMIACELLKGEHQHTTEIQIDGAPQKE